MVCKRGGSSLPFEQETSTWDDHILEVVANGTKRVMLYHATNGSKLIPSLVPVDLEDEVNAFVHGQVCPVGAILGVDVVWIEDTFEHRGLFFRHAWVWDVCCGMVLLVHVRTVRGGRAIVTDGGHDVLELTSVSTKLGGGREWMLVRKDREPASGGGLGNRLIRAGGPVG